jgi:hypothetical protein
MTPAFLLTLILAHGGAVVRQGPEMSEWVGAAVSDKVMAGEPQARVTRRGGGRNPLAISGLRPTPAIKRIIRCDPELREAETWRGR